LSDSATKTKPVSGRAGNSDEEVVPLIRSKGVGAEHREIVPTCVRRRRCAERTGRRAGEGIAMTTVMVFHEVDDVDHWLRSTKRDGLEKAAPTHLAVRRLQNRQRVEPAVSSAVPTAVAVRGSTS
jgi:hypothetical protein